MRQVRLLAGRYRVLGRLTAGPQRAVWLAEEAASSRPVIVAQVTQAKAQWLGPTVGVTHAHLAQVVRVVSPVVRAELPLAEADAVPEAVAVAELVAGRTLAQAVLNGPLPVFQGVRCTAYVASAVDALHRRGGTHGAISDRSIVIERADEGRSPVLTQLSEPPHAMFASPERLHGGGPSQQDDVWALHALLYLVLVGRPPYRGKDAKSVLQAMSDAAPAPLSASGIQDERLQGLLDRGLHASPDERARSVFDFEAELFDWLSTNAPKEAPDPARAVGGVPGPAVPAKSPQAKIPDAPTPRLRSPVQPRTATLLYGAEPQEPSAPKAAPVPSPIPDLEPPSPPRVVPAPEPDPSPELTPEPGPIPAPKPLAPAIPDKARDKPAVRPRDSSPSAIPELEAAVVRPSRPRAPKPGAPKAPEPVKPVEVPVRRPEAAAGAAPTPDAAAPDKPVLPKPRVAISEPPAQVVPTSSGSLPPPSSEQAWAPFAYEPGPEASLPIAAATPKPKRQSRKTLILAVVATGAIVTVGAAVAVATTLLLRGGDGATPAVDSVAVKVDAPPPPVVASVAASLPIATTASAKPRTPQTPGDVTRCVSDFFPEGTFDGLQDLAFVCDQPDARKGASTMRSRVVIGARGNVTKGMHEWSRLEWHEIAVWAIFRHACCADPAPLELPPPVRGCGSVGEAADALGRAFVAGEGLDDRILQFHRAADCAHYGKAPGYHYPAGPISGGQVTFAGFLERNQKRRAGR